MRTVVVPLDGSELSERALAPALVLARRSDAELRLVSCPWEGVPVDVEAYLADHASNLDLEEVTTVVGEGRPAQAVLDAVVGARDPLVCMATHGHSGVVQALLGSVAEEVLRLAPCPLLLCGPELRPEVFTALGTHLVVCTDGSEHARAVLPASVDLARVMDLDVTIVEVVAADEQQTERAERAAAAPAAAATPDAGPEPMATWLSAAGVGPCRSEQLRGTDVAATIVHHAARLPAAAVALASHGRSGIGRVVIGSVAMSIVRHSPCPVLVVRPPVLHAPGSRAR
jgi:nucleotide-binding universal stress UspA family protein